MEAIKFTRLEVYEKFCELKEGSVCFKKIYVLDHWKIGLKRRRERQKLSDSVHAEISFLQVSAEVGPKFC
jgi:hypothetical protein